jgi:hypothetical protein
LGDDEAGRDEAAGDAETAVDEAGEEIAHCVLIWGGCVCVDSGGLEMSSVVVACM